MTTVPPHLTTGVGRQAELNAARLLLDRMGVSPADLLATSRAPSRGTRTAARLARTAHRVVRPCRHRVVGRRGRGHRARRRRVPRLAITRLRAGPQRRRGPARRRHRTPPRHPRQHHILAVQLAKAAHADSFAAVTIAALARQSYDASEPADGLELVQLAQHGTRHTATPTLHAMLATREAWAPRNRAMDLIGLARVHLLTSEPDHAATLVNDALPLLDHRHPGRMGHKLGDFDREASRYADVPAVRDRIHDLAIA